MAVVPTEGALLCALPLALAIAVGARLHPTAATAADMDPGAWDRLHAAVEDHTPRIVPYAPVEDPTAEAEGTARSETAREYPVEMDVDDSDDVPDVDDVDDQRLEGASYDWSGGSDDSFWHGMWNRLVRQHYGRASGGYAGASPSRPAYLFMASGDPSGAGSSPFTSAGGTTGAVNGVGSTAAGIPRASTATAPAEDPLPTLDNARVRIRVDVAHLCALQITSTQGVPRAPAVLRFLLPGDEATHCSVHRAPSPVRRSSLRIDWADPAGTWSQEVALSLGDADDVPEATVLVTRGATRWAANLTRAPVYFALPEGDLEVAAGRVVRAAAMP